MAIKRSFDDAASDDTPSPPDTENMADDEPAAKRQRNILDYPEPSQNTIEEPEAVASVTDEGDTILVVQRLGGVQRSTGIRVSSHAMRTGSQVFATMLHEFDTQPTSQMPYTADGDRLIDLSTDDGDSVYLLCCILHLRNDTLPPRVSADLLFRFVGVVLKYDCVVAVSRAVSQWFDYLWAATAKESDPLSPTTPLFNLVESAYLLNDALYFARFTARWVLNTPMGQNPADIVPEPARQRLALALLNRQKELRHSTLVSDLDLLLEPLAESLSDDAKHYIDCAPGDDPLPEEIASGKPQHCPVDRDGATEFLSALRDAKLWPSSKWGNTIADFFKAVAEFRVPEYDATDNCFWCLHVDDKFATALSLLRTVHLERLWGLCLDCYKAGGVNPGDCRYEHFKPGMLSASVRSVGSAAGGGAPPPTPATAVPPAGPPPTAAAPEAPIAAAPAPLPVPVAAGHNSNRATNSQTQANVPAYCMGNGAGAGLPTYPFLRPRPAAAPAAIVRSGNGVANPQAQHQAQD